MAWSEKAIQAAKKALLATPCTFFEDAASDVAIGNAVCRALDAAAAVDGDAQTIDDVLREAEERILRISEKHEGHIKSAHTGVAKALAKLRSALR